MQRSRCRAENCRKLAREGQLTCHKHRAIRKEKHLTAQPKSRFDPGVQGNAPFVVKLSSSLSTWHDDNRRKKERPFETIKRKKHFASPRAANKGLADADYIGKLQSAANNGDAEAAAAVKWYRQFEKEFYGGATITKMIIHKDPAQKRQLSAETEMRRVTLLPQMTSVMPVEVEHGTPSPEDALIEMIDLCKSGRPPSDD